jgi:hypothetical protein
LFPIDRDATQKGEVTSNQGIFKKLSLRHKIKQGLEGEADDGDIRPVLVFRKDDGRAMIREYFSPLGLHPIENGENESGHLFGDGIDEGASSHPRNQCQISKCKCQMNVKIQVKV